MENLGWGKDAGATDYGYMLSDAPFDLNPGSFLVNKFLKWGYYDSTGTQPGAANLVWRTFLYKLLYHEGYYRGDVNQDGKFDVGDIIYLINFTFKSGLKPKEFVDQGDVNNDGKVNVQDIIIIINNRFKGGPYPIDKNRFLDASPFVDPAFKAAAVKNPGLFADPNWKNLGQ